MRKKKILITIAITLLAPLAIALNIFILILVGSFGALFLAAKSHGELEFQHPNQAELQIIFSDVDMTLPSVTNITVGKLNQHLTGNTITIELSESAVTNAFITNFGTNWNGVSATVPSRINGMDYPWDFSFERRSTNNSDSMILIGMQFYN